LRSKVVNPQSESSPGDVCIRPHELELHAESVVGASPRAEVLHINPLGPVSRVQLVMQESGAEIKRRPDALS
jgi:hypothetical protein